MARFTTRVELHGAAHGDESYKKLHAEMESEGFTRTITDDNGKKWHLPTAEYDRRGELTRQQVLDAAKRAADKTGKKSSILVTESNGRQWDNLTAA